MRPTILVAGLGRCGSSLTMQMLAAAGVPCVGEPPAYEVAEMGDLAPLSRWQGHAMKWLDPHLTPLPRDLRAVVLFLVRDHPAQAESQIKFGCMLAGLPRPSRRERRRWTAGLRRDEARAYARAMVWPHKMVGFADLVGRPAVTALRICEFLSPWFPELDAFEAPRRMASCVRPRGPECQPGLDIEVSLIEEADHARRV